MQMNLTTIPILNDDGTAVAAADGRNSTQPVLRFTARVRSVRTLNCSLWPAQARHCITLARQQHLPSRHHTFITVS